MFYWKWVNSCVRQWADLALQNEHYPNQASSPKASPAADGISPQEKYEYMTTYGTQILCLLDHRKGCTYLSRNFESITGQPCESKLGERFFGLVHGDHRARLKELLQEEAPDKSPYPFRCRLQHGDKKWYWYLLLIHPKEDGAAGEYVCIIENIHDHMLAQNTLQKARLEAELALRARSEFLSNMSHELRTPLNAVLGFSQIIESEMFGKIDNPQYIEYVRHIQEGGLDLLAKIEDLLEIANIDAGRVVLKQEEVYLSEIIKQVTDAQTHHAVSGRVQIEYRPKGDPLLFVDRLKLQHILGHLVANAIRYSRAGGSIVIEASRSDRGGLQLSVHDSGGGIEEAKLADITNALSVEKCWTAKNSHSLGIGLALTKEFIEMHGGKVSLSSTPSIGTSVHITLPRSCIRVVAAKKEAYPALQVVN